MEDRNELDKVKAEAYDFSKELNELRAIFSHLTQVLGLQGNVSVQEFVDEVKKLKEKASDKTEAPAERKVETKN